MILYMVFPGGSDGKASVYNAGDLASVPGSGRFPGEGSGSSLQYSCLENPMDGGAWCRLLSMGSQRVGHDWATSLTYSLIHGLGFPCGWAVKKLLQCRRCGFNPWMRKIPWRRAWQPTPACLENPIEVPGGLWFIRLQRVRHNYSDSACTHAYKVFVMLLRGSSENKLHMNS